MLNKTLFLLLFFFGCFCGVSGGDKFYVEEEDLSVRNEGYYMHLGQNVWLNSAIVYRDNKGVFSYENSIKRVKNGLLSEYEKKWKCPYCFNFWPIGIACQNKDCPSKFR